jgi:hypothetical protein
MQAFEPIDGSGPPNMSNPTDLAFSSAGNLFVLDIGGSTSGIFRFNTDGSFDKKIIDYSTSPFTPSALTVGPDGDLYVSGVDSNNNNGEVLRYSTDGVADAQPFITGLDQNVTFLTFAVPEASSAWLVFGGLWMALALWRRRQAVGAGMSSSYSYS